MVPGELPGANVPPLLIVVAPTVPVPASVPPLFTVIVELGIVPFTTRVPALIAPGQRRSARARQRPGAAAGLLTVHEALIRGARRDLRNIKARFWRAAKP